MSTQINTAESPALKPGTMVNIAEHLEYLETGLQIKLQKPPLVIIGESTSDFEACLKEKGISWINRNTVATEMTRKLAKNAFPVEMTRSELSGGSAFFPELNIIAITPYSSAPDIEIIRRLFEASFVESWGMEEFPEEFNPLEEKIGDLLKKRSPKFFEPDEIEITHFADQIDEYTGRDIFLEGLGLYVATQVGLHGGGDIQRQAEQVLSFINKNLENQGYSMTVGIFGTQRDQIKYHALASVPAVPAIYHAFRGTLGFVYVSEIAGANFPLVENEGLFDWVWDEYGSPIAIQETLSSVKSSEDVLNDVRMLPLYLANER